MTMLRFIPYVLKTLWRHRTRTALTVSGTAVALFVFAFVESIQEGMDRLAKDQQADRTLIVFSGQPLLPQHQQIAGRLRRSHPQDSRRERRRTNQGLHEQLSGEP